MSARFYFAWQLYQTALSKDAHNEKRRVEARARASFNYNDLTEEEFVKRYRLTKEMFIFLVRELQRLTSLQSSKRVSVDQKVLTALFFYATGSYQRPIGVASHVSQKACCNYIHEVTEALTHPNFIKQFIKFPDTLASRHALSQRFFRKYMIPGVVGCIDGSHFKIVVPPKEEEHRYYSRKHYHSLNVQMVCDDDLRILSINPKFGGANHDAFIWENSDLNNYVQSLHRSGEKVWLLGDSGYPQRPWMMTPILDAAPDSPEAHYNHIHMRARVLIENTFSRLKNRWRCLHKDRVLHYRPAKCAKIIVACSVLHNLCINFNIEDTDEDNIMGQQIESSVYTERGESASDLIRGRALRRQLVRRLQSA